jgi:LPS-assembly protein
LGLTGAYRELKNNQYLPDSREAILNGALPLTDSWTLYGGGRRNLELDQMVASAGGLLYRNECFNLMLQAARNYTRDRDIEPSTSFTFRFGFKNLGEFGDE